MKLKLPVATAMTFIAVSSSAMAESGIASTYHDGHSKGYTAAHRSRPLGTRVLVTNKRTGRSVTVKIVDRGPYIKGRTLDLNSTAAAKIALNGLGEVSMKVLR
jgi:rare lipoprotein A